MGKRKDKEYGSPSKKKQKKHKKHKKKRDRSSDNEEIDVVNDDSINEAKGLKLKIKFGGQTLSTTEVVSDSPKDVVGKECFDNAFETDNDQPENEDIEKEKKNEEEVWLDALEKGDLDYHGDVKKEKDSSLMTARQRALHGENVDGETELLQLPMYPEKTEEENEEFERKRKLRAKKRKQQMQKQIEETKIQTVEKLLTKGQKGKKDTNKVQKTLGPHIRYIHNQDGIVLSFTDDLEFPLKKQERMSPKQAVRCSVKGCLNLKKYSCSTTKQPICSLQCYKKINNQHKLIVTS